MPFPLVVPAIALVSLALTTACTSSEPHSGEVRSGQATRMTYAVGPQNEAEGTLDTLEMLTDGAAKVKLSSGGGGGVVTDGVRAVQVDGGGDQIEMKVSDVPRFVVHDGDGTLAAWCADAKAAGTSDLLNRTARHYTCREPAPSSDTDSMATFRARELWVDQQTGLIMKWIAVDWHATASGIDLNATIASDTFSLAAASGTVGQPQPGLPKFQVPRIGGGELTAASFQGAPLVIVTGDVAGIRALVDRLLRMTGGGKSPVVIALLTFDDFKDWSGSLLNPTDVAALAKSISASVGAFKVPIGIDFKGVVASELTSSADPGNRATSAVLIDRSGTVVGVAPAATTDDKLKASIGHLS